MAIDDKTLDELAKLEREADKGPCAPVSACTGECWQNYRLCCERHTANQIAFEDAVFNALPALIASARELARIKSGTTIEGDGIACPGDELARVRSDLAEAVRLLRELGDHGCACDPCVHRRDFLARVGNGGGGE
jgi:hypothetical protein